MQMTTQFVRPSITTRRLVLRLPEASDRDAIAAIAGDWDVAQNLSAVPHPYSKKDADFFIEQVVPSQWVWAITLGDDKPLIGSIGLSPIEGENAADLGYWLSRDFWGNDYTAEAARAVLNFGFMKLDFTHVTAGPFANNAASIRILEKLGFSRFGKGKRGSLSRGKDQVSAEMRITREAFTAAP